MKGPHTYEVRHRKDKRGFDLIPDALRFGGLWYAKVSDAIEYAKKPEPEQAMERAFALGFERAAVDAHGYRRDFENSKSAPCFTILRTNQ